jgi:hypothetical protein
LNQTTYSWDEPANAFYVKAVPFIILLPILPFFYHFNTWHLNRFLDTFEVSGMPWALFDGECSHSAEKWHKRGVVFW